MAFLNRLLNSPSAAAPIVKLTIDGTETEALQGSLLIDAINRTNTKVPQVCYHPQLGPIATCDTCMVEVDGKLTRACTCEISAGISVDTQSKQVDAAQREAFDRILEIISSIAPSAITTIRTAPSITPRPTWT